MTVGADFKAENAKILIIDDSPANLSLLARMLSVDGYRHIKTLSDSRKALETYLSYKPDLLLLDLQMPYKDGFEVMRELNENSPSGYLPVIMITAYNDTANRLRALEIGVQDFIGKPFNTSEVLDRIRNILEVRLMHNDVQQTYNRLTAGLLQYTSELGQMQAELIERLLLAAEFRVDGIGNHINCISAYVYHMSKAIGLDEERATQLYYASRIHDIGKIGIPEGILLKDGPLSHAEWEIMKQHTIKGARILAGSNSPIIQLAEEIALTHHEKWDGSGYPYGLKGEAIPLSGRITAICDVFDALVSKRPYKPAWPVDRAVAEIVKGRGQTFDPKLVDTFMNNLDKLVEIRLILSKPEIPQVEPCLRQAN